MKTLVISDTHLSHVFDEKKFLFLQKLFSSVDRVILNGDFWDGYRTTFDAFITSQWSGLFPLLKAKRAIYLYGNHDQKQYSDSRVYLFSLAQKNNYLIAAGPNIYHVEHGHILSPTIDITYPHLPRKTFTYASIITQTLECIFGYINKPHIFFMKGKNKKIKKKLQDQKHPFWYVCGHTHFAEVDIQNKFANSGSVQFGQASYLIVDSNGITLRMEQYK